MSNTSEIVVPNYFLGRFECDVLKISKAGQLTEYEIKVSRADFKKDFEKYYSLYFGTGYKNITKHDVIREGKRVNRFYYVVPNGLIKPEEVPVGFGLIYATEYNYHQEKAIKFEIKKVSKLFMKEGAKEQLYKHLASNLTLKLIAAKRRAHIAESNARELRKSSQA